ncbi:MAG: 2,3,4,5-tetrahydropyridine-2,6-carboxylate N-succinyltransferase [Alphaproteobacteria bacterium]|jgi:2,3,4,5-tetrahydropyridine-2-carboxylate N-succinyltransferase|nr:2,3,4,5-tetrahydropyridine-2,6-carboxylate N-succinyltransferase [Alphaproteobacteria bacterium]
MQNCQTIIEDAWEQRETLSPQTRGEIPAAIDHVLALLDQGALRVASKAGGTWETHQWIKKAILLSFRLKACELIDGSPLSASWFDKVPLKGAGWTAQDFAAAGFRAVPGSIMRHSAYIGPNVVLMPSFVNVGAYVGAGTMIDTWSTVGSCAQIGKNCHISGGVGIGGVLEPLQASPVIIEDNCFIGARSEIAEGAIVSEGSVISMGVFIGGSTKIINRQTGDITYGYIPPYSVVVPGTVPVMDPTQPALACAVIVKQVDARTRAKTAINDLLRF